MMYCRDFVSLCVFACVLLGGLSRAGLCQSLAQGRQVVPSTQWASGLV